VQLAIGSWNRAMEPKPPRPAFPLTVTIGDQTLESEELIKECEEHLDKLLDHELDEGASFETYEQTLLKIVHEIARRKLEKKLQTVADGFAPRLAIDHANDWHGLREDTAAAYRRHCPGVVTYHSLVGPLRVRRYTYRECGRHGPTHVPLDLAAGLMERMTPALARCVALGYAHMPLRTCEELMIASGLRPPSRSTLDRTARDLGAYAVASNTEIEPLVRANEVTSSQTRLVAVGLDRVAVPMRHGEELVGRSAYSADLRRSRPKPKKRAAIKGPVQWRMDYVGTVALLDEDKNLLESRKYRLPGDADVAVIVERVMADVRHVLMQRPVEIAVIQDGAPELWSAITTGLAQEPLVPRWTEVLDWYHLDERLSKCLDVCVAPAGRESLRRRWHRRLLETKHGADQVIRSLRGKARTADAAAADQLAVHIGYIERNKQRMEYVAYRRRKIPIGSGITEGACKSVVNVRAKRSGQRWSQRGLTAALHLRAIHESNRFDGFWAFFTRRYRAKHIVPLGFDSANAH
jgi:hypothetical protein